MYKPHRSTDKMSTKSNPLIGKGISFQHLLLKNYHQHAKIFLSATHVPFIFRGKGCSSCIFVLFTSPRTCVFSFWAVLRLWVDSFRMGDWGDENNEKEGEFDLLVNKCAVQGKVWTRHLANEWGGRVRGEKRVWERWSDCESSFSWNHEQAHKKIERDRVWERKVNKCPFECLVRKEYGKWYEGLFEFCMSAHMRVAIDRFRWYYLWVCNVVGPGWCTHIFKQHFYLRKNHLKRYVVRAVCSLKECLGDALCFREGS